jgi:hypothetical protein
MTDSDLCVTVSAEQNGLCCLGSYSRDTPSHPIVRQGKRFLGRIEMMELQGRSTPVMPAQVTLAAGFVDKDAFHAAPPVAHSLLTAQ